jgi:hypothetical protein
MKHKVHYQDCQPKTRDLGKGAAGKKSKSGSRKSRRP